MSSQKSGLLDQILLEDIARYCPQQFLAFHQCMTKPEEDPNGCAQEQFNLASCIRRSVPTFQRIQGVCAGKLQAYEACLTMNNSKTERCTDELQSLRDCAFSSIEK
ncbi:uncharacterized protein PRCAT00002979001 [Priceomyces carsonii]|uniref:uncharacterized protein n=1 Tax=Priceomyces carsonii TaxID=28549 RepID=UPI002EDB6146|nr:unnamed protein product [Priceomyces carsonii]